MIDIERNTYLEIFSIVKKINISKADMCLLMTEFRKVIELSNSAEKYKVLHFYCDWAVHASLDRNKFIPNVLNRLNLMINLNPQQLILQKEGLVKDSWIGMALYFDELIEEISVLLHNLGVELKPTNVFLLKLLQYIVGIPIYSPKDYKTNEKYGFARTLEQVERNLRFVDEVLKYNPCFRLDPTFNYLKPILFVSLQVVEVKNNVVLFQIEADGMSNRIFCQLSFEKYYRKCFV